MVENSIVELPHSSQSVASSTRVTNSSTQHQDMDAECSTVEDGMEMSDHSTADDSKMTTHPSKNYRKEDLYARWHSCKEAVVNLRCVNKGLVLNG